MVVLRRVQKLATALPNATNTAASSDTALGDWYVTRLVADRRPLLLLVCANALLPILVPAREVRTLPLRLPSLVAARLQRLSVPAEIISPEISAMRPVLVGPTADRSVVGILVEFARTVPLFLDPGAWDETTLPFVEAKLARTPCYASRRSEEVVFPDRKARTLLNARWGAG
jgi:hypothetical protein